MPECIRCGGCCLTIPCCFAQIQYGLTKDTKDCPDLQQNMDGTYTCRVMWRNNIFRHEMLGTGCHYPEYRKELTASEALAFKS